MTDYEAIALAEGFSADEPSAEEYIAAWQHLIDTGICWRLQGWFGRTASRMIDGGFCSSPNRNEESHDFSPCTISLDDPTAQMTTNPP